MLLGLLALKHYLVPLGVGSWHIFSTSVVNLSCQHTDLLLGPLKQDKVGSDKCFVKSWFGQARY
jgi:hypothetical protein